MNIIVDVDQKFGIGYENNLLFNIPRDKKFLRDQTVGKTVIMGRKTMESLPFGKPLKDRVNIVLTRNKNFTCSGVLVYNDIETLLNELPDDTDDIYVIGGEEIYTQFLPYCKTAYITKIKAEKKADKFFPQIDEMKEWKVDNIICVDTHCGVDYEIIKYSAE